WASRVAAILQAWYPGTEGGVAISRLLSGAVNPSGHLALTLAASKEQLTHPHPPKPGKVHYTEGATVDYKWFDQTKLTPLSEFGHGLSYTTFAFGHLSANAVCQTFEVTFSLTITVSVSGKDVGQIYVARSG